MKFNKTLLKKYNHPVPRYTSYPPANFFTDVFTGDDYKKAIKRSNQWEPQNISIYIHIPFCKKLCYYCGCNMQMLNNPEIVEKYIEAIKKEILLVSKEISKERPLTQIHYGGGTPNAIPAKYLKELNTLLFETFTIAPNAEIAIECNPAYLDFDDIKELNSAGFNRYSIGIQDFNEKTLKAVNRSPSKLPIAEVIKAIKEAPDNTVNLDFIYGLPTQTPESFSETIQKAIALKPERLVTFSYAHVPWVNKAQKILETQGLPSSDEKMIMYEKASELLTANGYIEVGMDHFVLENDTLNTALNNNNLHRNFQGYCTRGTTGQVYAFGISGISQLQEAYAQNTKSINDYIKEIANNNLPIIKGYQLSEKEIIIREAITELMCNRNLNWEDLSKQINVDLDRIFKSVILDENALTNFEADGIITRDKNSIKITEQGILFIRNVAASIDPLMKKSTSNFSKPV